MRAWWAAAWKRDEGQGLIEYSILFALVAVGLLAVLLLFRDRTGDTYGRVGSDVDAAGLPVSSPHGGDEHGCGGGGGGCGSGREQ